MKFKILKYLLILLLVAVGNVGCGNSGEIEKETEEESQESGSNYEDYSLDGTSCRWIQRVEYKNDNYQGWVTVINSEQELKNYITSSDGNYPEIDFSEHSLLIASGVSNVFTDISKNLQQLSSDYLMDVEITTLKNVNYRKVWHIALLTGKISEDSQIELNVITSYDEEEEPELSEVETGIYAEPDPVTYVPIMGYTKINFIDKDKLVIIKHTGTENENHTEFNYEISGYTIKLAPVESSDIMTVHYFRIINHCKFEMEYLYPTSQDIRIIPPIMTFEKE